MKRIFVFEYLTAGGLASETEATAQALLPMGLAMRDAMVTDLLMVPAVQVSTATCSLSPAPPAGATACQAPAGGNLVDWVRWQSARHDAVWLVAPETDGLLAQFQGVVPAAQWLGCDPESTALASRKQGTLARLAAHGIQTPLAFSAASTAAATRWVVKPDDGAGGLGARVFDKLAGAHALLCQGGGQLTLEPWVEGEPLSLSLLCRASGAELLSINRQHIRVDDSGQLHYEGVSLAAIGLNHARAAALDALAQQVHEAIPGLRGFVGIDLVWHADLGPVVIEVNPRVTCAYVGLSAQLKRNLAAEIIGRERQPMRAAPLASPGRQHVRA